MNVFPGFPISAAQADVMLSLRAAFGDAATVRLAFDMLLGARKTVEDIGLYLGHNQAQAARSHAAYQGAMLGVFLSNRVAIRLRKTTEVPFVSGPTPEGALSNLRALRDAARIPDRSLDQRTRPLREAGLRLNDLLRRNGLGNEQARLATLAGRTDWTLDQARGRAIARILADGADRMSEGVQRAVPELGEIKQLNFASAVLRVMSGKERDPLVKESLATLADAARQTALWKEAHLAPEPLTPPPITLWRDVESGQVMDRLNFGEREDAADRATRGVLAHLTGIPVAPAGGQDALRPEVLARDDNNFYFWRMHRRTAAEHDWTQGAALHHQAVVEELSRSQAPDVDVITIGTPGTGQRSSQTSLS